MRREKRRICVVITARPSYSRIKTALEAIKDHPYLELQVIVSAAALNQDYGHIAQQIERDGFNISTRLHNFIEGGTLLTMARTTGLNLFELPAVLEALNPNIVVTIADRYETLATAAAASYMNIPVAHVQGGEVTGSIDEKVRHAVTKLSDIHLVSSKQAAGRIIRMGEDPSHVYVTGCPSLDLAYQVLESPKLDFDPLKYSDSEVESFIFDDYLIVMHHPVTTEISKAEHQIIEVLNAVQNIDLPIFWFLPNIDAGTIQFYKEIKKFRIEKKSQNFFFMKNLPPIKFLKLLYNAKCLIGNSSVGIRESTILGSPVVNIGTRQQGRERGKNVLDVEYNEHEIFKAIQYQMGIGRYLKEAIYGDGKSGIHIANILSSCPLNHEKRCTY